MDSSKEMKKSGSPQLNEHVSEANEKEPLPCSERDIRDIDELITVRALSLSCSLLFLFF